MAIAKKVLGGLGKAAKGAWMGLSESRTVADGGLTALVVPRQLNPAGLAVATAGLTMFNMGKVGVDAHSRASMGKVVYDSGMARMTSNFQSGAVPAMMQASGGNYEVFSGMAKNVVSRGGIMGGIQDNGANPAMISALYHMGGR